MMRSASAQSRQGRAASNRLQGILEKNGVVGSKLLAAFASENPAPAVDHVELRRVPAQVVPRAPFLPPPSSPAAILFMEPTSFAVMALSLFSTAVPARLRPAARGPHHPLPRPAAGLGRRSLPHGSAHRGESPCPMRHACRPVCFTAPHGPGCQSARQWTSGTLRNGAECLPLQLIRGRAAPMAGGGAASQRCRPRSRSAGGQTPLLSLPFSFPFPLRPAIGRGGSRSRRRRR